MVGVCRDLMLYSSQLIIYKYCLTSSHVYFFLFISLIYRIADPSNASTCTTRYLQEEARKFASKVCIPSCTLCRMKMILKNYLLFSKSIRYVIFKVRVELTQNLLESPASHVCEAKYAILIN